ncbi:hypothetical protein EYC80_010201 [Monilinia laxa]|uniref:Uncharacterized protein n=1 Tax=Monilinia laxa TaxID=61186 RepID=A0A5N6JMG8_MONLA|nr:hypothetical protein EYC80_010201 [Monilinia laxa]
MYGIRFLIKTSSLVPEKGSNMMMPRNKGVDFGIAKDGGRDVTTILGIYSQTYPSPEKKKKVKEEEGVEQRVKEEASKAKMSE